MLNLANVTATIVADAPAGSLVIVHWHETPYLALRVNASAAAENNDPRERGLLLLRIRRHEGEPEQPVYFRDCHDEPCLLIGPAVATWDGDLAGVHDSRMRNSVHGNLVVRPGHGLAIIGIAAAQGYQPKVTFEIETGNPAKAVDGSFYITQWKIGVMDMERKFQDLISYPYT